MTINTSWWYSYPSEKYDFVNWDDEIPNIWKNKSRVPVTTNQYMTINMMFVGKITMNSGPYEQ